MGLSMCGLTKISLICSMLLACGKDKSKTQSLQDKFEAVYGFTDCKEVVLGTGLAQPTWIRVFQTYYVGYLDQKESTFLDENCQSRYTTLNRWATFQILSSSNEETGEIHLEIKTRRILSGTNENAPSDLPGIPDIDCNSEMAEDLRKDECKTYFDANTYVSRYVTLNLNSEGLQPFKNIDSAGITEDTRSTELAPYVLNALDPIDK